MIVPTVGRLEMLGLRQICETNKISFVDAVWKQREAENPRETKSTGAWPYKPASALPSNVTPIRKGGRK